MRLSSPGVSELVIVRMRFLAFGKYKSIPYPHCVWGEFFDEGKTIQHIHGPAWVFDELGNSNYESLP